MKGYREFFKDDSQPAIKVSWYDAYIFCKWASGRLPTEAEWEYAARGGATSKDYKYAGSNNLDSVAWYDDNSGGATHTVGTNQANELGLYDMSGNVYEWCQDRWHSNYDGVPIDGSAWEIGGGSFRVVRGGGWSSLSQSCRSAYRYDYDPVSCFDFIGFRVVFVP